MDQQDQSGDPMMHSATFGKPNTAHQLKQLTAASVMIWVWSEFQIAVNREGADGKKKKNNPAAKSTTSNSTDIYSSPHGQGKEVLLVTWDKD